MDRSFLRFARVFVCLAAVAFISSSPAAGQQRSPVSYETVLQLVVGSTDAAQRESLPAALAPIARRLGENFPFSRFKVTNTFLGRSGSPGRIEYKSVADPFGARDRSERPTFLDWSLSLSPNDAPDGHLVVDKFRFGARVPVVLSQLKNAGGQVDDLINYEAVGLTTERLTLSLGRPSLIGTISLPGAQGTLFLILTVRPAD
ncbi:MAG: hypothetical protein ACK4S4_08440 [Pyrinomonadaceae bacterium]